MVVNMKTGKPRGYAFLEYEKERDMHGKYVNYLTRYLLVVPRFYRRE